MEKSFALHARQRNGNGHYFLFFMILFTTSTLIGDVHPAPLATDVIQSYLEDFGYLRHDDGAQTSDEALTNALHAFQRFAGLPDTGLEDDQTLDRIQAPRCGDTDLTDHVFRPVQPIRHREKRWYIFQAWPKNNLTYKISSYTSKLSIDQVNDAMRRAFRLWSDVALINFTQIYHGEADIDISFHRLEHGDGRPFDGPGYVLGHTFPPSQSTSRPDLIGTIHMDEDENWTVESSSGKNLWLTAAHEIGHAIGLSHSRVLPAIMYPWYPNYDPNFALDRDDIIGIQFLYGARPGAELSYPVVLPGGPNNPNVPNLCAIPTDSMTFTIGGIMYAFKGSYYWQLEKGQIIRGYPKLISENWPGLQSNITSALSVKNPRVWGDDVGNTFFFKDRAVWKYNADNVLAPGFPKDLQTLFPDFQPGIPINSVNAVAEISGNGETIFLIDGYIYLYSWERVFRGPYAINQLIPNLEGQIISLLQGPDNFLYFFMSDGMYYQVSPWTFGISAFFPKPTAQDWFSCNE